MAEFFIIEHSVTSKYKPTGYFKDWPEIKYADEKRLEVVKNLKVRKL